jgi:hypothetical protein
MTLIGYTMMCEQRFRRIRRSFIGRWLDDRLHCGPDPEIRATLIEQLAP